MQENLPPSDNPQQNGNMRNKRATLYVAGILAIILIAIAAYFGIKSARDSADNELPPVTSPSGQELSDPSMSVKGELRVLDRDLGLFHASQTDKLNNFTPSTTYYDAGKIQTGMYARYNRVVAVTRVDQPGGPLTTIFATRDYQTYILDVNSDKWLVMEFRDKSDSRLDFGKVTAADALPYNHPQLLEVGNDNFRIFKQGIYTSEQYDDNVLKEIPSNSSTLPSTDGNLRVFAVPAQPPFIINEASSAGDKKLVQIEGQYLDTAAPLLVRDNTGLIYGYGLVETPMYERRKHEEYLDLSEQLVAEDFAPESIKTPGYSSYGVFLPGGCGLAPVYSLKNVSDQDLEVFGKSKTGQEFYVFRNKNHPLLEASYYVKISEFDNEMFKDANGDILRPSFEEYVQSNPVLVTKDPWGRWIVFGETKYKMPGGCGKPVVYLYPERPTEVSLNFTGPINITHDIPSYHNGWKVLADPDGNLTDLQTEFTDCGSIDDKKFGFEYASSACESNNYPYLYWSGFSFNRYPEINKGWIVSRAEVSDFLRNKVQEIGLNDKEISDMTGYWVPKILAENKPYYRLSFLQNEELNALFPMRISPSPESLIRVFLDWQPLENKPATDFPPQQLTQYERKGFTMVEWGGLNR